MFTIRDTMWTFHPDGTWFSVDGKNWTKGPLNIIISNMAFVDYVLRGDTLYGMGYFKAIFRPLLISTTFTAVRTCAHGPR
jgi:hypothetical protein